MGEKLKERVKIGPRETGTVTMNQPPLRGKLQNSEREGDTEREKQNTKLQESMGRKTKKGLV